MKYLLIFLVLIQPGYMLKWIDLSHHHGPDTLMVSLDTPRYNRSSFFKGDIMPGVYMDVGEYSTGEHGGTHMDAPKHFVKGGRGLDEIPLESTIADGVMIDCSAEAQANSSYQVSKQKILDWEKINGKIPMKSAILFNFNWSMKFDDEKAYKGATDLKNESTYAYPTVSFDAVKWLFDERQLQMLGTDTLLPEPFVSAYPIHRLLLSNKRIIAENLNDLFLLPARGFRFHCAPVKYVGSTGAQVRAYAMVDDDTYGVDRNKITRGHAMMYDGTNEFDRNKISGVYSMVYEDIIEVDRNKIARGYAMVYDDRNGVDRNTITAGLILCWIAVVWIL